MLHHTFKASLVLPRVFYWSIDKQNDKDQATQMSTKGSSVKRIRLSVLNVLPFLLFIRHCSVPAVCSSTPLDVCHTQHTQKGILSLSVANQKILIEALCSLYGIQLEEWTCQCWGNKFQSAGMRYLPPITSSGKSKPKLSFAFAGKCEELSFRPVSQTVNNHVFYQVPVSNSSELSAAVINYLSLI